MAASLEDHFNGPSVRFPRPQEITYGLQFWVVPASHEVGNGDLCYWDYYSAWRCARRLTEATRRSYVLLVGEAVPEAYPYACTYVLLGEGSQTGMSWVMTRFSERGSDAVATWLAKRFRQQSHEHSQRALGYRA